LSPPSGVSLAHHFPSFYRSRFQISLTPSLDHLQSLAIVRHPNVRTILTFLRISLFLHSLLCLSFCYLAIILMSAPLRLLLSSTLSADQPHGLPAHSALGRFHLTLTSVRYDCVCLVCDRLRTQRIDCHGLVRVRNLSSV
jgi:hypothetical protein